MQTTCGFGHLYDSDQYASCPYCNRGAKAIVFSGNGAGKTTMPVDLGGGTAPSAPGRTVAPGFGESTQQQTAGDIGKTVIPDYLKDRMQKEEKNKTIGVFKKKTGLDPVVGWLVCIEGPEKGKDYRLFSRINMIGRAETNDVVLAEEQTVSQVNHARLAYDEKHNNFQMIPGDGHNVAYVNDAPLYIPQLLQPYDVIEFGDTKLVFIPLCSDRFQWKREENA